MHVFIYDAFVNQKKYAHTLARIETRITDLGLNGKIIRLGLMKNVRESVERELKQGAKTMIAVGNSGTVNKVLNAMVNLDTSSLPMGRAPLGLIPIGKKNNGIALGLGIESEEVACDVLSARRIESLDLGLANEHYFLSQVLITTQGTILEVDQSYSMEINEPGQINVINLSVPGLSLPPNVSPNPLDNKLDLCVTTLTPKKIQLPQQKPSSQNIIPFNHLNIINQAQPVIIDNSFNMPTPVEIRLAEQKLPVIVGKGRSF